MTRAFGGAREDRADANADAGAASLLVAVWMAVFACMGAAALALSGAMAARSAAAAAADLGALAGATAALEGAHAVCVRAASTVRANGALLTSCRIDGTEVWVETSVLTSVAVQRLLAGRLPSVSARSHAELVADDSW